ncbi:MAG: XTP/dITP diphosphatase [candidate division Zixibacteria bacterium]|nr:XTP/dITP diphosphatase [candidate division Zixibacteria bacterium]
MQLVLATNNRDKIREIKHLLEDLPATLLTADDFLDFPDPEETGITLVENAILKARAIARFTEHAALADDSGLEVDALGGAPGVYSSRYAGEHVTYKDNYTKLLREMAGVPEQQRTARFRCVMAIVWEDSSVETVEGVAEGMITTAVQGDQGFGYDPVFFYPPLNKRFSEMTLEEKNQVSHRGKALQAARELIIRRLSRERG